MHQVAWTHRAARSSMAKMKTVLRARCLGALGSGRYLAVAWCTGTPADVMTTSISCMLHVSAALQRCLHLAAHLMAVVWRA
jgi:hypothetical protein